MVDASNSVNDRPESYPVVDLSGTFASVRFSDELHFPRELLEKSPLLRQALSDFEGTSKVSLPVPQGFLQSWLQWRMHESVWDMGDRSHVPQIVKFLSAADYLGDEEACTKLCEIASKAILPQAPDRTPIAESHVQALNTLPSSLLESVFANCKAPLAHMMAVLPPHMHMAALHVSYPSVYADASMNVSIRDVLAPFTLAKRFWELLGQLSSLQHLSIDLLKYSMRDQNLRLCVASPGPLSGLTALTYLKFNGALLHLGDQGWDMGHLSMLRHLDLAYTRLGEESMNLLAPQLKVLTGLEHLDLRGMYLKGSGAKALARCLPKLLCLKHLDLAGTSISNRELRVLAPQVATLTHLTVFHFNQNQWDKKGAEMLSQLLEKMPGLQKLDYTYGLHLAPQLSVCTSLRSLAAQPYEQISQQLTLMPHLTELTLRCFEHEAMEDLAPALGQLSSLRVLDVNGNGFGSDAIKAMLSHISHLTALQGLHMLSNELNDSAMTALAQHLESLSSLQHLELGRECRVSRSVSKTLVESLQCLTALTHLHLHIECKDSPAHVPVRQIWQALAESLSDLKRLEYLRIQSSHLDAEGLRTLAHPIGSLSALVELDLDSPQTKWLGVLALCPHLLGLKKLEVFCIRACQLSENSSVAGFISVLDKLPELRVVELLGYKPTPGHVKFLMNFLARRGSLQHLELNLDPEYEKVVLEHHSEGLFVSSLRNMPETLYDTADNNREVIEMMEMCQVLLQSLSQIGSGV